MNLDEIIRQARPSGPPVLPVMTRLSAAAGRVLRRWPDVIPDPPERDREQLVQRLKVHLELDRWDGVRMSFVSAAARATFDPVRRRRPDLESLRAFFVDEIGASHRSTFLGAMFTVYLESFEPGSTHTTQLAEAIGGVRHRLGARWRSLIESLPDVLKPEAAADAIARAMVGMKDPWSELKSLGLRSPHAPGLMDFAHLAYVARLEPHLKTRAELDQLLAWLKPEGQSAARMSGASESISAILGHWRTGEPPEEIVGLITQSLVRFYDDPRIQRGGAWTAVPQEDLAVIMRWLTGEDIRFFMKVVSAVEDSHMWEPRRRFWLKLHDQRRIDAAWVAFSSSGADYARRMIGADKGRGVLRYGTQTSRERDRVNTSLLILKIGNKIIVEGSHNYQVHIFSENNPRAPMLYQDKYDCETIRRLPGSQARIHDKPGRWRDWVEERI